MNIDSFSNTYYKNSNLKYFGYLPVYTLPPVLTSESEMQLGNTNKNTRLTLKDSKSISSNYIGVCTTRMPKSAKNSEYPCLVQNLIDGDKDTSFCSFPTVRSDSEITLYIDLPYEQYIDQMILSKRPSLFDRHIVLHNDYPAEGAEEIGRAMAHSVKIDVSCDNHTFTTIYNDTLASLDSESFTFAINTRAKFVKITLGDLSLCERMCYAFSIANLILLNENGENIALLDKGASISTDSQASFYGNNIHSDIDYWQLQSDLGVKWSRIGYHDDPINWHWVEKSKGVYDIDPISEESINYLYDNGIGIIYNLCFGNRLYETSPRVFPHLPEWNYEPPMPPTSEEALVGWDNFVKWSVTKFKDKVKYFEVWNEWNGGGYWGTTPNVEQYISLALRTIKIIRALAPNTLICMGSSNQFVHEMTRDNCPHKERHDFYVAIDALAPYVDAIGYHPFYQPDVTGDRYLNYDKNIEAFTKYCRDRGFKGVFMASEFAVGANYPAPIPNTPSIWWGECGKITYTEIQKAKILTQLNALHHALGIVSCVCELSNVEYPLELSLLKRNHSSAPCDTLTPSASYYATRNICSALDGYEKDNFEYKITNNSDNIVHFSLTKNGSRGILIWRKGEVKDIDTGVTIDIEARGIHNARATYLLNGTISPLNIEGDTIRNIVVRDCPTLIQLD